MPSAALAASSQASSSSRSNGLLVKAALRQVDYDTHPRRGGMRADQRRPPHAGVPAARRGNPASLHEPGSSSTRTSAPTPQARTAPGVGARSRTDRAAAPARCHGRAAAGPRAVRRRPLSRVRRLPGAWLEHPRRGVELRRGFAGATQSPCAAPPRRARRRRTFARAPAGGEKAGRTRLESWLANGLAVYAEGADDLGADASSRLSPYLHFGCLSPLEVAERAGASARPSSGSSAGATSTTSCSPPTPISRAPTCGPAATAGTRTTTPSPRGARAGRASP